MNTPMDCAAVEPLLDEYASTELGVADREAVSVHLGQCPSCRHALRQLLALDERLRALPATTAQEDFLAQVEARLASQRLGFDQRTTAPSGWLGDHGPTPETDETFLRFRRIAA